MSAFEDAYKADNPVTTVPTQTGTTSVFDAAHKADNPDKYAAAEALPGVSKQNSILSYITAPLVGALKGAVNTAASIAKYNTPNYDVADFGLPEPEVRSPYEDIYRTPNNTIAKEVNKNIDALAAPVEKFKEPKDQVEAGLQGAGQALGNPLTYMFGAAGIAPSVISEGVTYWRNAASPDTPIKNAIAGTAAGILAPAQTLSKLPKMGYEWLTGKYSNPIIQAQKDLGITGVTAAGIGAENSWKRTIRFMRESPLSSAVENAEGTGRKQLGESLDEQANKLGISNTKEQAAEQVQLKIGNPRDANSGGWINDAKQDLNKRSIDLNNKVDPATTNIDIVGLHQDLQASLLPPKGAFQMDPGGVRWLDAFTQNLNSLGLGRTLPASFMPLSAVQYLKKAMSDKLDMGLFAQSDMTEAHIMGIWAKLTERERQAYKNTPYANEFENLQKDWAEYFSGRKIVKDYIRENISDTAALDRLLSEKAGGGERLNKLFNIVPGARTEVAAWELRRMGMGIDGMFNPDTFFKNWTSARRFAPEAKAALYGPDVHTYDQLALAAQEQARSETAKNFSGTAGTYEALKLVRNFVKGVAAYGGVPALGVGAASMYGDGDVSNAAHRGEVVGAATYLAAMSVGPKLFTNPTFVRMLATDPPVKSLPLLLRGIAANNPNIAMEATALQNYVTQHLQPGETGRKGFAEGGIIEEDKVGGYRDNKEEFMDHAVDAMLADHGIYGNGKQKPPSKLDELLASPKVDQPDMPDYGWGRVSISENKRSLLDEFLENKYRDQGRDKVLSDKERMTPYDYKRQTRSFWPFAEGGSVDKYTDYEGEPISQDKWLAMQPSYNEGQMIPNQRMSVWELFKTEREAAPNKFEREEQLRNGINNHPQEIELASGGPFSKEPSNDSKLEMMGYSGGTRNPILNGPTGVQKLPSNDNTIDTGRAKILEAWENMRSQLLDPVTYPVPQKVKEALKYFDNFGYDSIREALRDVRQGGLKSFDTNPNSNYLSKIDDIAKAKDLKTHSESMRDLQKYLSVPPGTYDDTNFASGGAVEDTKKQITTISEQKGLPSILGLVTAQIESNFGRSPDRPGSQYQGIYQMGHTEAREMGGRGIEHGIGLLARRKGELANKIGREPALWEIYLAHNQGVSGAASLLSNPNMSSGEAITKAGGRPINISSNFKGNPNAPSSEFTEKVRNDFNRRATQLGGSEEAATATNSPVSKSNNSAVSTNPNPQSIINMFVQSEEDPQEEIDTHENTRTALLEGADAPTQAAIKSILGNGQHV